jgi:hypothetical protein
MGALKTHHHQHAAHLLASLRAVHFASSALQRRGRGREKGRERGGESAREREGERARKRERERKEGGEMITTRETEEEAAAAAASLLSINILG